MNPPSIRIFLISVVLVLLAWLIVRVANESAPGGGVRAVAGYRALPREAVGLAAALPVQDGGRIKPLSTYAGFTLLRLYGARSMTVRGDAGDVRLGPVDFLLDCFFRPGLAVRLPAFRVDNSAVIEAIGLKAGSKRDRYSYEDLESGAGRLFELAGSYQGIARTERDPVQTGVIDLADNLRLFIGLLNQFAFSHTPVEMKNGAEPGRVTDLAAVLAVAPVIREERDKAKAAGHDMPARLADLMKQVGTLAELAESGIAVVPPRDPADPVWQTMGRGIFDVLEGTSGDPDAVVDAVRRFEVMTASAESAAGDGRFTECVKEWHDRLVAQASGRGEYRGVLLEDGANRRDWFFLSMIAYLLGSLAVGVMFLAAAGFGARRLARGSAWAAVLASLAGFGMSAYAIGLRCVIMRRSPVGNLYDTIIFISAAVVLLALVFEWFTRRRFALALAPVAGTLLVLLSRMFEVGDARDHADPLVAVLSSNFWLTIHVITITLGYAGGLLAALFGVVFVMMRGLRLDDGQPEIGRALTRGVYACVCLTLFLSLTGTVLGGIWANYSWGRFWGWDPKENGALLIVLWNLAVLHARLGGWIRERGLHLAAVAGAAVVVFSWWHVNFLNTGLHSYGFTSGKGALTSVYAVLLGILIFGAVACRGCRGGCDAGAGKDA